MISVLKVLVFSVVFFLSAVSSWSQTVVGLDNWFNREQRNGQPYHYVWNDTTDSGYSRWGSIFKKKGASIETIGKPTAEALSKINVYIIVDPDTLKENPSPNYILPDDISVISSWVKKGGVLILLANDAPNCEFTHLNQLSSVFGIVFNHVSLHPVTGKQWEMGAFRNLPAHPVFTGVGKIYMKEVSSLSLSGKATPVLSENNTVFIAECKYGKGWVVAVGDPWIYNEYIDHDRLPNDFENRKAAENLSDYLIKKALKKK